MSTRDKIKEIADQAGWEVLSAAYVNRQWEVHVTLQEGRLAPLTWNHERRQTPCYIYRGSKDQLISQMQTDNRHVEKDNIGRNYTGHVEAPLRHGEARIRHHGTLKRLHCSNGECFPSYSQHGQDIEVFQHLKHLRGGIFVDIGSSAPIGLSNTYSLYKHYGWKGICVDANPEYVQSMRQARKDIPVVQAAVSNRNGERLRFATCKMVGGLEDRFPTVGNSTQFNERRKAALDSGECIEVETQTITRILNQHREFNHRDIDYMSIDVEGGELQVLQGINWERYTVKCLSVEHNGNQQKLRSFMRHKGYESKRLGGDLFFYKPENV